MLGRSFVDWTYFEVVAGADVGKRVPASERVVSGVSPRLPASGAHACKPAGCEPALCRYDVHRL